MLDKGDATECQEIEETRGLAIYQKIAIVAWILILGSALGGRMVWPESFSVEAIGEYLKTHHHMAEVMFLVLVCVRPVILVPGTVLTFAGLLVFTPMSVFLMSMVGVVVSGAGVYFASYLMGFDRIVEAKYEKHITRMRPGIKKHGGWFIAVWSAFPLVPDDVICYLAGALRYSFWKFLIGFTVGGAIPIAAYSFGGGALFEWLW
ncbi:TVP38/TMEM64 family protein [Planctomycetota bacterium]|nr:TVP38/TMEM64 family protein [Planctomycetota bacterium]